MLWWFHQLVQRIASQVTSVPSQHAKLPDVMGQGILRGALFRISPVLGWGPAQKLACLTSCVDLGIAWGARDRSAGGLSAHWDVILRAGAWRLTENRKRPGKILHRAPTRETHTRQHAQGK